MSETLIPEPGETVDAVAPQDSKALVAELEQARERIEALARDLHAVDGELSALATDRERHRLLEEACRALGELDTLGGAPLFWGDAASAGAGAQRLRGHISDGVRRSEPAVVRGGGGYYRVLSRSCSTCAASGAPSVRPASH